MSKLRIPEILLADDDRDDCLLFKDALEEFPLPFSLTTVHDGKQLMDYIKKATFLPDLLFLDLNMPRKSGYECLTEIKQDPALKGLQIIVISTSFEPDVVELVREKGARHYICKPNDYGDLVKLVHSAVSLITRSEDAALLNQPPMTDFVLAPGIVIE